MATLSRALIDAAEAGRDGEVGRLLGEGADVDSRDVIIPPSPIEASRWGHLAARDVNGMNIFMYDTERAELEARGRRGCTALMMAVMGGHLSCVRRLLASGADPWLTDGDDKTASDMARGMCAWAKDGDHKAMMALLEEVERGRKHVVSLRYACRYLILQMTSRHHLCDLPLPPSLIRFLKGE